MGRFGKEIEDALDSAAESEQPPSMARSRLVGSPYNTQKKHELTRLLLRLLENLPDELTVAEIREELE